MKGFRFGILGMLVIPALVGCGGQSSTTTLGGGTSGSWNPAARSQSTGSAPVGTPQVTDLPVFLTCTRPGPAQHLRVRLHRVILATSRDPIVVFESEEGDVLDLAALRDRQGPRYVFVGLVNLADTNLVRAEMILDRRAILVPRGGGEPIPVEFDSASSTPEGKARLTMNLNPRGLRSGLVGLILDVDASRTSGESGRPLVASLREGDRAGLENRERHERSGLAGQVSSLAGTAPAIAFSLQIAPGRAVRVATSNATTHFGETDEKPVLEDGRVVEVRGTFSTVQKTFLADSIVYRSLAREKAGHELVGRFVGESPGDGNAMRLRLAPLTARGFVPPGAEVEVAVDDSTRLLSSTGTPLEQNRLVESLERSDAVVEGVFEEGSRLMRARIIRLEPVPNLDDPRGVPAGASGSVTRVDAGSGRIQIALQNRDGFDFRGSTLEVSTGPGTLLVENGKAVLDRQGFLARLSKGETVSIRGLFRGGRLIARRIERGGAAQGGPDSGAQPTAPPSATR